MPLHRLHESTGDPVLDKMMDEFAYTQDIDTFIAGVTWARHPQIWREIGSPQNINRDAKDCPLTSNEKEFRRSAPWQLAVEEMARNLRDLEEKEKV